MECTVEDCGREAYVRSMCQKHYQRWRRHGDPTVCFVPHGRADKKYCEVPGCGRSNFGNGLCVMHYNRAMNRRIDRTPEALREYEVSRALEALQVYGLVPTLRLEEVRT